MKKLTIVLVAAAMASMVFAQQAGPRAGGQGKGGPGAGAPGGGERRGPGGGRMNGQMAEQLGLNETQKKQLKELNEKRRTAMEAIFKKYNVQRPQFGQGGPGGKPGAAPGGKPGKNGAGAPGGKPGAGGPGAGGPGGRMQLPEAARTEMKKVMDDFQAGLKKILTPAQQAKLQTMMPQGGRGFGGPGGPGGKPGAGAKGGAKGGGKAKP